MPLTNKLKAVVIFTNQGFFKYKLFLPFILVWLLINGLFWNEVLAAPPSTAVKFVILNPGNSTVEVPVTVTIQAQKSNNQVDANYQQGVTLVTSG